MATILRRENDLTVLRIRLDRRGVEAGKDATRDTQSAVVVEVQVGTDEAVVVGRVPVSAIGLGDAIRGDERTTDFRLPDALTTWLTANLAPDARALWLEIPGPCGHLRLVPWEALLIGALDRPVLRLPYFSLLPQAAREPLELAVCVSSPGAKTGFDIADMVDRYLAAVSGALQLRRRVHVFADADQYEVLDRQWHDDPDVVVHDPRSAEPFVAAEGTPAMDLVANVRNPWLQWMLYELDGRAIDAAHFICHGYYAGEHGAIALASSPLAGAGATYSRFIGAGELSGFLTAVGAWAVGLTGPEHNYAPVGLRDVADNLAQTRPLHVVVHEIGEDPQLDEVAAAYGLMFALEPRPAPLLGASALWVHPKLVAEPRPPAPSELAGDQWLDRDAGTALFGSATKEALYGEVTPTWVASSARVIEQAQGDLLGPLGATRSRVLEAASPEDVAEALRAAAGLLERHVIASASDTETGEGGGAA